MNRRLALDPARMRGLNLPPASPPSRVDVIHHSSMGQMPEGPSYDSFEGSWQSPGCNAHRVQLAGGFLNSLLVDPMIEPFERLYRRLPEESMFMPGVSTQRPVVFELGAFQPPQGFNLLLFDLRPDIYRQSGMAAGDTVPVEARRFSTILGFDLLIDGRHHGNNEFQLDPIAIQLGQQQAFTPPPQFQGEDPTQAFTQSQFNIAAASSFAGAAGAGTALMPQRPRRYGPLSTPFTLYVRANQTVQLSCVVFRPIPSPIAFVEYDIAGFLLPEAWVETMRECLKPLSNASGGPGSRGGGPR